MSGWDGYLARLKPPGSTVLEAGIFGLDGAVWISTPGMPTLTREQINILSGPEAPMHECGPMIGDKKCMLIKDQRKDKDCLCLNLKANMSHGGHKVCVGQTNTALVIAIGEANGPEITGFVHHVTNHLKESNY